MTWLVNNWSTVLQALWSHLALAIPAIALSFVLSLPVGWLAYRYRWSRFVLVTGSSLIYAIPSLPLLIVLPALIGTTVRSPVNVVIALTGYGMALIERRCAALYAALTQGGDPGQPLRPLAEYLHEETDYRASPRHAADGRHWAEVLAAAPRLHVLQKGSENHPTEAFEAGHDIAALRPALLERAGALGMGWPDLLTALCAIWTALRIRDGSARQDGDDGGRVAMPVWLPYMSRMGSVSMSVPALVVNILPLLVTLHPDETLAEVLARLGTSLRKLRRHGRYRIEQIAEDYAVGPKARFFFSPLINVLPFDEAAFAGCDTARHVLSNGPGDGFNITIRGDTQAHGLELLLEADPALTPGAEFTRLAAEMPRFLARALAGDGPSQPLRQLLDGQPELIPSQS